MSYGILPVAQLRWPPEGAPTQFPDSYLDYAYDAAGETNNGDDPITEVAVSSKPSGAGETVPDRIAVQGDAITVWMDGGFAGRVYDVKITITLLSGRVFTKIIRFPIDPSLATWPLTDPFSDDFGTPITWQLGINMVSVATALTATGNSQGTAALLLGLTNVFTTVPSGTGATLSNLLPLEGLRVTNAGANDLLVYPPVGAQINSYSVNEPVTIGPNQSVVFSAQFPATQWYAQ
jgi:hypothetical protein